MIRRLQPVAKLYLLVAVLCCFIIAMGIYGIVQMNDMNQNMRTLYNDRVIPMEQLGDIRFYYEKILYVTEQYNNRQISPEQAYKLVRGAQDSINVNWKAYLLTYLTPEEKKLADSVNASIEQSGVYILRLENALSRAEAAPPADTTHAVYSFIGPLVAKTTRLLQLQVKISGDIYQSSRGHFRALLNRFIGLILLSLAFVLPFSYLLVKNIKKLISDLHASNQKISMAEEKYRHLFNNNPAYIMVWDPETLRVLEVNDKVPERYGYTREEFKQMSVLDYRRTEDYESLRSLARALSADGALMLSGEWMHISKSGEEMLMAIASHRITYNNRPAVLSLGNDVTETVKAQRSLLKSEEKFRALIDHAAEAIFMVTDAGVIFDVNLSAAKMFGYNKYELIGMRVLDLHPPEARAGLPILWNELRQNKSLTDERELVRKDGTRIEVQISRGMLPDASGAIAIVRDIRERKEFENHMRRQNEALLDIAFLQSHIMRRPAANIIGLINLFNRDDYTDPLNLELIVKLKTASAELDEVINQVVKKVEEIGGIMNDSVKQKKRRSLFSHKNMQPDPFFFHLKFAEVGF